MEKEAAKGSEKGQKRLQRFDEITTKAIVEQADVQAAQDGKVRRVTNQGEQLEGG